jgi:4-azaleucine resistance transporter AzlC
MVLEASIPAARRRQFWAGVRAELPILLGVFPFGLIYGALALNAGLSPGAAQAMSSVIFAGSAQFIAAGLFGNGVPGLVIVLTVAVVNLRHALYSASVAPYLKNLPGWTKALLAYLLTDEAYAVSIINYQNTAGHTQAHWFFAGAGLALWLGWQISTALGILTGAMLPASWSLDFAIPLTFIALAVPAINDRSTLLAALAAGATAVLASPLPYKLGIILAAVVGVLVGMLSERKR